MYGQVGIRGCYQPTYNEQSDIDGAVLGRDRAGSWASCVGRELGSLEC